MLRDTRLKNNIAGLALVYTYYKHAAETASIMDENPDLQNRLQELVDAHRGRAWDFIGGSEITVSSVDVKEIADFMEQLKAKGSLKFQRDIDMLIKSLLDGSLLREFGINENEEN
jgi:hypothetical protein